MEKFVGTRGAIRVYTAAKLLAGAALRPPPHPLPHSAGVAVPAAAALPRDEAALCHVSPDPSAVSRMLSLMLPGNVVVADVTISPRTVVQPGSGET